MAMRSIRRAMLREADDYEEGVDVFGSVQGVEVDFARVHKIMLRECRRLKEGLPIYAYRRRILNHIFTNQVTMVYLNSLRDFNFEGNAIPCKLFEGSCLACLQLWISVVFGVWLWVHYQIQ